MTRRGEEEKENWRVIMTDTQVISGRERENLVKYGARYSLEK
jgi:hypothetical protein